MPVDSRDLPPVSLVIPTYESAATVGGTITSALTQTYPRLEIIVVDDGSTDETPALLAAYGARIRVVRQDNGGLSCARNAGARAATGELVAFVDADDLLLPQYVERMVAVWQGAGGGRAAAASNAYLLRTDGISIFRTMSAAQFPRPGDPRFAILQGNFLSAFMLFPTDLYRELGGCDESLRCAEDWDLWLRAIYSGVVPVYQPSPQALYRWRPGSMSADVGAMSDAEHRLLQRAHDLYAETMSEEERTFLEERLRTSPRELQREADEALLAGEYREAARLYGRASTMVPRDWKLRTRYASLRACPPAGRWWRRRMEHTHRTL